MGERKERKRVIRGMWKQPHGIGSAKEFGVAAGTMRTLVKSGHLVHHTTFPGRSRDADLYQLKEFKELDRREIREAAIRRSENERALVEANRDLVGA